MPICKEERIIQVFQIRSVHLVLLPLMFEFCYAYRHQDAAMNGNADCNPVKYMLRNLQPDVLVARS